MKLAIFDVDGTLTDTNEIDESSHLQAFRKAYRIDNISTDWSQYENATDPGLIQEIFEDHFGRKPDPEQILHFRQTFLRILKSAAQNNHGAFREIQGALRMLELLADDPQWRIAIATGCFRESAFLNLETAGIPFSGFPLASGDDGITRGEIIARAIASGEAHYEAKSFPRSSTWEMRFGTCEQARPYTYPLWELGKTRPVWKSKVRGMCSQTISIPDRSFSA